MDNEENLYNRVHFVGIGGIGMSGIASILLKEKRIVSGSDLRNSSIIEGLRNLGAKTYLGHSKDNIERNLDVVVYSAAISQDNPEIIEAKNLKIPVIKRAEMLAYLMNKRRGIAISGAHGKTTTTSLVSHILIEAGFNPTVAVGGILRNLKDNAKIGSGDYFVIEADESDGSFLYYQPERAIITNIDYEHMDYYKTWNNLLLAYKEFVLQVKPCGLIYACGDDVNLCRLFKKNSLVKFYGKSKKNKIYPTNIRLDRFSSQFNFHKEGGDFGLVKLPLAGEHNILNALAAIGLCLDLGVNFKVITKHIKTFKGVQRRFQIKLQNKDLTVIEDYGHHPTEIKAVLKAAKDLKPRRLVAIFQPHRYSRTKLLLNEFVKTFNLADITIITDIYAASEKPIRGFSGKFLSNEIKKESGGECIFLPKEKVNDFLFLNRQEKDLMLFLGAGDINKTAWEFTKKF